MRTILPSSSVLPSSVPIYGLTQLGLRSHPSGSFVPETITTLFSFLGSDRPVYATASVRPVGPCQPTAAMAGPVFSYLRNPYPTVSGEIYDFYGRLHSGGGAPNGDSQISGTWTPLDRELHISCMELKAVGSAPHHWALVLQGHQVTIATDNLTVVSYINKQGGTRSHTLLHLVVELLMWLQAQNIVVRARLIPGSLNMKADQLSRPNQRITTGWSLHPQIVSRIFGFWGPPVVDMFGTGSNSRLPQFMSPIPEPRALAVDALSQDWQGRSMYMFPPFPLLSKVIQKLRSTQVAEVILIAPLVAETVVVSTPTSSLCGPSAVLSIRQIFCHNRIRDTSRTESRTVCMHGGSRATLEAAGFSDEVSRLAAAPRRDTTNRMYDDWWLQKPKTSRWCFILC